ncbi:MAG: cupin domain-containing protein [Desulfobacteraceae bacterium]|nr:cupin domain-containing protein [Desulfobacteraceae bacterium]
MRAQIKKAADAVEFETAERCFIVEVANDGGDEWVSIARARVAPGVTTAWHKLTDTAERYIIVQGRGRVQIGAGEPVTVNAGDVVRIPADTAQRIENVGTSDLIFYAVCSPPFKRECYISLE